MTPLWSVQIIKDYWSVLVTRWLVIGCLRAACEPRSMFFVTWTVRLRVKPVFCYFPLKTRIFLFLGTSLKPELEDASNAQEDFYVNEKLDLYCCFQSKEKVHVVWLKDNQTITSGARYQFSENNQVLTIPKASMLDGGKYRCEGSNKYGKDSWNIVVIIHSKEREM